MLFAKELTSWADAAPANSRTISRLASLFIRCIRAIYGAHADCLLNGDLLFRSPDIAFVVGASDLRLQRHHWLKGAGRIVRCLGWANAGVDEASQREHVVQALGAVLLHL